MRNLRGAPAALRYESVWGTRGMSPADGGLGLPQAGERSQEPSHPFPDQSKEG